MIEVVISLNYCLFRIKVKRAGGKDREVNLVSTSSTRWG